MVFTTIKANQLVVGDTVQVGRITATVVEIDRSGGLMLPIVVRLTAHNENASLIDKEYRRDQLVKIEKPG